MKWKKHKLKNGQEVEYYIDENGNVRFKDSDEYEKKKVEEAYEKINLSAKRIPSYKGNSVSIVDALHSMGVNASFAYRKKLAIANGIKDFKGTAEQNIKMLNMLRRGDLALPGSMSVNQENVSQETKKSNSNSSRKTKSSSSSNSSRKTKSSSSSNSSRKTKSKKSVSESRSPFFEPISKEKYYMNYLSHSDEIQHHGVLGMKWGIRRMIRYPVSSYRNAKIGYYNNKAKRLRKKNEYLNSKAKYLELKRKNRIMKFNNRNMKKELRMPTDTLKDITYRRGVVKAYKNSGKTEFRKALEKALIASASSLIVNEAINKIKKKK